MTEESQQWDDNPRGESVVEERQLERGQEVWIDGRRAILLDINAASSPIVRFESERGTRVVPMHKLRAGPGDSPAEGAAGVSDAALPPR